jgi:hypothetical protein
MWDGQSIVYRESTSPPTPTVGDSADDQEARGSPAASLSESAPGRASTRNGTGRAGSRGSASDRARASSTISRSTAVCASAEASRPITATCASRALAPNMRRPAGTASGSSRIITPAPR